MQSEENKGAQGPLHTRNKPFQMCSRKIYEPVLMPKKIQKLKTERQQGIKPWFGFPVAFVWHRRFPLKWIILLACSSYSPLFTLTNSVFLNQWWLQRRQHDGSAKCVVFKY